MAQSRSAKDLTNLSQTRRLSELKLAYLNLVTEKPLGVSTAMFFYAKHKDLESYETAKNKMLQLIETHQIEQMAPDEILEVWKTIHSAAVEMSDTDLIDRYNSRGKPKKSVTFDLTPKENPSENQPKQKHDRVSWKLFGACCANIPEADNTAAEKPSAILSL